MLGWMRWEKGYEYALQAVRRLIDSGVPVRLDDLALTGLRAEQAKDEKGRQFACPSCGASLTVQLASSKSMTCGSCNSIIDLSNGIGGELRHAAQDEPVQPLHEPALVAEPSARVAFLG